MNNKDHNLPQSRLERFEKAVQIRESDPAQALQMFTELQHELAVTGLLSSKNESLADVSTNILPFLSLNHHLALTYLQLPTPTNNNATSASSIEDRLSYLTRACDLWSTFLQDLQQFDMLSPDEVTQYQELVTLSSSSETNTSLSASSWAPPSVMPPPVNREVKIARFRAKQAVEQELKMTESLLGRRHRMQLQSDEEMDGHDEESLLRQIRLQQLQLAKADALDEWYQTLRELPLITMMVKKQQELQSQSMYRHGGESSRNRAEVLPSPGQPPPANRGPLQVTHITQDATTGQLQFRKEEIRAQVFRAGWNQPTMSLQELGDRELEAALEREESQRVAKEEQKTRPRRYQQLVKDGQEDDDELVNASAALDREWDNFKDENPRGSGNKRGDVGDRNF